MSYIKTIRKKVGNDPLVVACSLIIVLNSDGEVLLEERQDDHFWDFPGGSIEIDESAEDAAKRELFEETGLIASALDLFQVYSGPLAHYVYSNNDVISAIDIVYISIEYNGILKKQDSEVAQLKFFPWDQLPEKLSELNKKIIKDFRNYTNS